MKFSFLKKSKKLVVGALLAVSCLGIASVGFAEAKAYEIDQILKGSYAHTMRNEFFIREANVYNAYNPSNSWGEVIAREESGFDGSVTKTWMIGDLKRNGNNYVLNVKRQVIQKLDNRGNINMNKVDDVNYNLNVYHRMESGLKLEWNKKGATPGADIDGEYINVAEFPQMSSEAAMYVLYRFMIDNPNYRNKLLGAAMMHTGNPLAGVHEIKLVEHHPDHIVTRGTYQVDASGTILEYDVVTDKWSEITR